MNLARFAPARSRLAVVALLAFIAASIRASAQSTYLVDDGGSLARSGAASGASFTLSGTQTVVFRVVADYGVDAGIFTPSAYTAFANGQATTGWALFNNQFGTQSVTLAAGSYVVGIRNRANSVNNFRISPSRGRASDGWIPNPSRPT